MQSVSIGVKSVMVRVLNSLEDTLQSRSRLPRFLIILLDKDLIADFNLDDEDFNPKKDFTKALNWFANQVNVAIHRKRVSIEEMKPGAVFGNHLTVLYVCTLRRPTYYSPHSKIGKICGVRFRFNEALTNAAEKMGQNVTTISSCNQEADFDTYGNLTPSGARIFWQALDSFLKKEDKPKKEEQPDQLESYTTANGATNQQNY